MKLQGFVFGIRVSKSFYLEDKLGAIIDELLYTKDSAFGPSLFPTVQEQNTAKVLFNQQTGDKLTITHSDFIFEYTVKHDFDVELNRYLDAFKSLIIKQIFKKFDVRNIARFGFVIKSELEQYDSMTDSVHDIIKADYVGYAPDNYSLRFNVKEKKPVKIQDIVTEDFDNIIITYDKANEKSPLIYSVDYQMYFKPELNYISEARLSFEDFCRKNYEKYKKRYLRK